MNSFTRHVFTWCWFLLALATGIRGVTALTHIDNAHLNAEPSLCRRAGVPAQPTGCAMDAQLGWRFPWGDMLVSPLKDGHSAATVTVTPVEQRSLSYTYQSDSYHISGGMSGAVGIYLTCAIIGLLPSLPDIRRLYHARPWART